MGLREARRRRVVPRLDGRGWPQQPSKYQIDTVSYVNTLLHTFNPDDLRGSHRRRELGAPVHERARPGGASTPTTARKVLPAFQQFFPQANPDDPAAAGDASPAACPARSRSFDVEQPVPVLRLQHALQRLGQPHEGQGRAQHEDGPVRRAHDAPGAAVVDFNGIAQLQHRRRRTRSTRTSGSPTRCSAPSRSTRSRTATRRRTASS